MKETLSEPRNKPFLTRWLRSQDCLVREVSLAAEQSRLTLRKAVLTTNQQFALITTTGVISDEQGRLFNDYYKLFLVIFYFKYI